MAPQIDSSLPPGLAARPRDRRGHIVTYVTSEIDGEWDFSAIDPRKVMDCIERRLCGVCGEPLGYWIVFLGGPKAAEQGTYADPPMHPECAEVSLRLCPHIAHPKTKRAPDHAGIVNPDGFVDAKPEEWVLYRTRSYQVHMQRTGPIFLAAPAKELRHFRHDTEGLLKEVP